MNCNVESTVLVGANGEGVVDVFCSFWINAENALAAQILACVKLALGNANACIRIEKDRSIALLTSMGWEASTSTHCR